MRTTIACAVAMFCLITGYGGPKSAEGADLGKGKAIYQEICMLCHGPKGDGKGPGAIALNPKPADYTKKKFWEDPNIEKKIAETIVAGKGQMRPSPDLKPEDIESIILYMTQTFKPK
jgi:mono/diheme cytochrome c family protein